MFMVNMGNILKKALCENTPKKFHESVSWIFNGA